MAVVRAETVGDGPSYLKTSSCLLFVIWLLYSVFCTELSHRVQNVSGFGGQCSMTSFTATYLQVWYTL